MNSHTSIARRSDVSRLVTSRIGVFEIHDLSTSCEDGLAVVAGFAWNQLISLWLYFLLNSHPKRNSRDFNQHQRSPTCHLIESHWHQLHDEPFFGPLEPSIPLSQSRLRAQISSSLKSFETARVGPNRQKFLEAPLQVHSCAFYV